MRIVYFHNWSWLGGAIGRALVHAGLDRLLFVGAPEPVDERDTELRLFARSRGVRLAAPRDIGSSTFIRRLAALEPDLILVGTFPRKLPAALLRVPKIAALNVHTSLLPAYRGALPEFWALRNGERTTGISIHHMTGVFDAGSVISQVPVEIRHDDDLLSLSSRMAQIAPPMVLELLDRLRRGERPSGEVQDDARATRAPMPRDRHLTIDWREPTSSIDRLLRAARPFLDVFTWYRRHRLFVRRARRVHRQGDRLSPGILEWDRSGEALLVGAGDGIMELEELEEEGRTMSGASFARRHAVCSGERLE